MTTPAQQEFNDLISRKPVTLSSEKDTARSASPGSSSSRAASPKQNTSPNMPHAVYQIPNTHFDANTGPKGVIADAQSWDRARKKTLRQTFFGMTSAVSNNVGAASGKISSSIRSSSRRRSSGISSEGSDDDEFMRSWREKRIAELKNGQEVRTRRLSPSKRRYGSMARVDAVGYLDAVEKVASDTMVVVMIGDDDSPISQMVENAVSNLARKYEYTRFVKLHYTEAEMDPAGAPAILAYMGGELVANLVSVIDEIPEGRDLSVSSLEDVMRSRRILP